MIFLWYYSDEQKENYYVQKCGKNLNGKWQTHQLSSTNLYVKKSNEISAEI